MAAKKTKNRDKPYSNREIREKWHQIGNTLQEIKSTNEIAAKDFKAHQDDDSEQHKKVNDQLEELTALLRPIAEVYKTVATLGKWSKIGFATMLLFLSIAVALKNLWFK